MREGERDRERKQVFVKEEGMKNSGYLRRNRWPRDKIRRKTPTHCIPFCAFLYFTPCKCISYTVCVRAQSSLSLCDPWTISCHSLQPHGLYPAWVLCSWNFPGKNTGVGCHFLLQGIFPTQGSNSCFLYLLHCRRILYHCHMGSSLTILNK